MSGNKPAKVTLFTHTKDPLDAITLGIEVWHNPIPSEIKEIVWTEAYMVKSIRWLLQQPHTTPLEYFNMVWVLKGVSRAFQQQLTRYRMGIGYSIQSLRVVNVGGFADNGEYTVPSDVLDKESFHRKMKLLQDTYNIMIAGGEKTENARGILPLNIHSPITLTCNYRALLHIIGQRTCHCAQEEWKDVVSQMRHELMAKVHPVFAEPFDCQCQRFRKGKSFCKTDGKQVTDND